MSGDRSERRGAGIPRSSERGPSGPAPERRASRRAAPGIPAPSEQAAVDTRRERGSGVVMSSMFGCAEVRELRARIWLWGR